MQGLIVGLTALPASASIALAKNRQILHHRLHIIVRPRHTIGRAARRLSQRDAAGRKLASQTRPLA
jgi:hypothetical protein